VASIPGRRGRGRIAASGAFRFERSEVQGAHGTRALNGIRELRERETTCDTSAPTAFTTPIAFVPGMKGGGGTAYGIEPSSTLAMYESTSALSTSTSTPDGWSSGIG
jgi:hypothetical protein